MNLTHPRTVGRGDKSPPLPLRRMTQWSLNPIASLWLLVLLTIGVAAISLLPTFKPMPRWQRASLIGLRLAVIFFALLLMLRPTRVSTVSRPVSALVMILLDQSRSMTVPDMPDGQSRWQAQRAMLDDAMTVVRSMPKNIETKIFAFDAGAKPVELTDGALVLDTVPQGPMSDYGTALDDALRGERGKRLAAVIMSGDGAQRAYAPRVEMQQAAREVRRQGAPLYTVALGKDLEKSEARDVAIENMRDHYTVFVKNELAIQASLNVRGFLNQPIAVELVVEDASGKETILGPVEHTARKDNEPIDVQFNYAPQEKGQYRLTLRAAAQAGELVTKNNELTAFLTVRDGGLKVFYLEGEARHEYTFLRRALSGAEDIQLEDVWIDHNKRDRWPLDFTKQLADPTIDVFILGSVSADALSEASVNALVDAVAGQNGRDGKGLLLLGGRYSYGPGRWASTKLADLLPMTIDSREAQDFDGPLRADRHWQKPLAMRPVQGVSPQGRFIVELAPNDQDNRAIWQALKPLTGANRFDNLRPQALVLAESLDGVPLVVARNFGDGRVLAIAGDSTYQWAMQGHRDAHARFWRQAVLWLAKRDADRRDDVWIDLDQRRFNPGGRVEFTTGVKRSDGGAMSGVALTAEVTLPDGKKQSARLVPEAGEFLGLFKETQQPGNYTIEVRAAGIDRPAVTRFVVLDEDLELGSPSANPEALAAMADVTKEFGGRRVAPEEVKALLEEIKNSPPNLREEVQERFELGRTAGTAWLFFVAMVGLMGGEWFLRKKWGLI